METVDPVTEKWRSSGSQRGLNCGINKMPHSVMHHFSFYINSTNQPTCIKMLILTALILTHQLLKRTY